MAWAYAGSIFILISLMQNTRLTLGLPDVLLERVSVRCIGGQLMGFCAQRSRDAAFISLSTLGNGLKILHGVPEYDSTSIRGG